MRASAIGLAILLALLGAPDPAQADCATAFLAERFEIDPDEQGIDTEAPDATTINNLYIKRKKRDDHACEETDSLGCAKNGGDPCDCSMFAWVEFAVLAEDNRTPVESMGFIIEITEGEPPPGFQVAWHEEGIPDWPLKPYAATHLEHGLQYLLSIAWYDTWELQEQAVSFAFTVSAVDVAGNIGPPSEPVEVSHPGFSFGGCSSTRARVRSFWPVLLVLLVSRFSWWGRRSEDR